MHEMSIVRAMANTVIQFCKDNNVSNVSEIVMQIGELSLVIPEYVEKVYPVVVKGTELENAKLIIEMVEGLAECDDCDEIFNVVENKGYCPNCGSFNKQVLSGKDVCVKEIHTFDDAGNGMQSGAGENSGSPPIPQ